MKLFVSKTFLKLDFLKV